jgi:predicted TIM-barrel fold metal-dependent hydrolase
MRHTLSRRRFLGSVTAASALSATPAAAARRRGKYIDIHTHVGTFYWGQALTADGLVRLMDRHDIERAVVLPLVSPEAGPYPQTTESALAAHRAHKDRLVPFCCVDPRCLTEPPRRVGHVAGYPGLRDILRRYRDAGCRGLGEHKTGLPFDHPLNMTLYRACEELSLPVLFHLDDLRNPDTPGLPRLANALKAFPRLPFIGHAAGFWASISGDATLEDFGRYPKIPTPVAPGGALGGLMDKFPNLYGDLSEPGGHAAIARDRAFGRDFLVRRADRLLFGTDFLMADQEVPHFALFDSLDLPAEVRAKIFRGNAARLLKLGLLD